MSTLDFGVTFVCPHCEIQIHVAHNDINCQIFRCGVYKSNIDRSVSPHASKLDCDKLVADGLIFGCGKPFRFDGKVISVCDYI